MGKATEVQEKALRYPKGTVLGEHEGYIEAI